MLFEETDRTLFCSGLLTHDGTTPRPVAADVVGPARVNIVEGNGSRR